MPNWTTNIIHADGREEDIRAFLEAMKWQDEIFDFNRLIPMPELLKHTGCGRHVIGGKDVTSWYVTDPGALGPTEDNSRLFTEEEEDELKRIGYSDWYAWANANWGVKWNASRAQLIERRPGRAAIQFDTAWCEPFPIFEAMFNRFPNLTFECDWQHEDEAFTYSVSNRSDDGETQP